MAALRTLLGISSPITGSSQLHPPLRGGSLLVGGLLPLRPPYPRCGRLAVAPPLRCGAPLLRHSATLRARSPPARSRAAAPPPPYRAARPPPPSPRPAAHRAAGRSAPPGGRLRCRVPVHRGCPGGSPPRGGAPLRGAFPAPARGLRPALWGAHPQGRTPEGGERKKAPIRKLVHIFDPPQRARHVVN